MANAKYDVLEIRFIFEPELTQVYALCTQASDGTFGVGGWHHKTFPPSVSAIDVMTKHFSDHLLWPLNAPPLR